MLDLLHRHIDGKGKQAKLKSPNELQVDLHSLLSCLICSNQQLILQLCPNLCNCCLIRAMHGTQI